MIIRTLLVATASLGVMLLEARATPLPSGDFGGDGGEPFAFVCPDNGFLIGLDGNTGAFVDHINMKCSQVDQNFTHNVPIIDARQIGGSNGGGHTDATCPTGSAVGAMFISSTINSDNDRPFVVDDTTIITCTDRSDRVSARENFGSDFDDRDDRRSRGTSACPPGQHAVGLFGKRGLFVDRLGLLCDTNP